MKAHIGKIAKVFLVRVLQKCKQTIRIPHNNPGVSFSGMSRVVDYITENSLRILIERFFEEHGMDIYKHKMRIHLQLLPSGAIEYYTDGFGYIVKPDADTVTNWQRSYSIVRITTDELDSKPGDEHINFMNKLAHELDHILWAYENKGHLDTFAPYWEREHEKRAYDKSMLWALRFEQILADIRNGASPV